MIKHIVGLLDYGAGNCTSVRNTVDRLGFRSRLVKIDEDFNGISILLIPGVGAFPAAMNALRQRSLVKPILEFANLGKPIIGVCLGMQLLAEASYEMGYTRGLELIAGEVVPMSEPKWHIGWNSLEIVHEESIAKDCDRSNFYFNHSFEFKTPSEYIVGVSRISGSPIVSMVRRRNICGFQFHPEKSQLAGIKLMERAIKELIDA